MYNASYSFHWMKKITAKIATPETSTAARPAVNGAPALSASTKPVSAATSTPTGSIRLMLAATCQSEARKRSRAPCSVRAKVF